MVQSNEIIIAPATMSGGAIAVIRVSGEGSIALTDKMFRGQSPLAQAKGYTLHYGNIVNAQGVVIDDVLVSVFRAPHSYTAEEGVEISCHGSQYIVQQIIALALGLGARMADAGEFTLRAYLAGRMDLSQAEAVADLIASTSEASHRMASTQMRGGYSSKLGALRSKLLHLTTLLELELDFSQEDVEFADRGELSSLMQSIAQEIEYLEESFKVGNAIKNGVSVAIVGEPNAGKSTLLNRLLNDDRAMVSEIAGTTRDVIEESIVIGGITFRFIDTAGIHSTDDRLEKMGIERSFKAIERAQIVIQLVDATLSGFSPIEVSQEQRLLIVRNKVDLASSLSPMNGVIDISAREDIGISELLESLLDGIDTASLYAGDPIVSNSRHIHHLHDAHVSLNRAQTALIDKLPTDLLCQDIREVLHHIGAITGEISTDEVLGNIFQGFCIGK